MTTINILFRKVKLKKNENKNLVKKTVVIIKSTHTWFFSWSWA